MSANEIIRADMLSTPVLQSKLMPLQNMTRTMFAAKFIINPEMHKYFTIILCICQ